MNRYIVYYVQHTALHIVSDSEKVLYWNPMEVKANVAKKTQYIFVTGGVLSGVGKGITAASMGAVLQAKGLTVSIQKCDPYLNVDAGLLNPAEHGECFVTRDGAETDLDLGHYERFLDIELTQKNATLSGRLFRDLIADERAGKFGGKTIQLVPHLTGAIQRSIEKASKLVNLGAKSAATTPFMCMWFTYRSSAPAKSLRVSRHKMHLTICAALVLCLIW